MKLQKLLAIITLSMLATLSYAHEGHEDEVAAEPVMQEEALQIAGSAVTQLVEQGKIDAAWAAVKTSTAKKERMDGIQNWVVSFPNATSGQTLNIVLSNTGVYQSVSVSE